ncbi:CD48 antigen isoform X2 [Nothobranchius furzeri]|uniref:Transcript variant X1 n=1 Tax=Nothobranchius furzeri TaxID=105023 RepID=A0A9D2Y5L9_NOTFU|nr:transcript variant X1 [Nothobranchius furzeri]
MSLLTVFLLLQGLLVVPVTSISEAVGYVGEDITLPFGANASLSLSVIEWSILSNNTLIATYRNGAIKLDRFHLYKGRLTLNAQTGDLTILNLSQKDAMEYTVRAEHASTEIQKKIRLAVKQRLQAPTIRVNYTTATETGCFLLLTCSSPDDGVGFFWKVQPHCWHSWNNTEGDPSQLVAYCNTQESVEFTCTSKRQKETMEAISTEFKIKCDVPNEKCLVRDRWGLFFIILILNVLVVVLCFLKSGCRTEASTA